MSPSEGETVKPNYLFKFSYSDRNPFVVWHVATPNHVAGVEFAKVQCLLRPRNTADFLF